MWILHILIFNLTIVFVVELTLAVILGARNFKKFITVALINIITNPLVVITMLTVTIFYNRFETFVLVVLELAVFFTEGFLFSKYKPFKKDSPYFISLILNLSSYLAGEILMLF